LFFGWQIYKTKRTITNLSENEDYFIGLMDTLSFFILQVVKKDQSFYPLTK